MAFLQTYGMPILLGVLALGLIFVVLLDVFEVMILPRRVTRPLRLSSIINLLTWLPWSAIGRHISNRNRRENFLGVYGPIGLIGLLFFWAVGLIAGFALLQWACGSAYSTPEKVATFGTDLYVSGTTFFTLGLGDVVPLTGAARALTVVEAGFGFGILAVVIGYLPVLYQAFSRREVNISLLDARAGSPPSAVELLRRYGQHQNEASLSQFLYEWERWSAELLESHLSYPTLAYFRSQHDNQSWLAGLTMILDACSLIMVGIDGTPEKKARLTFAMARHAAVDLAQIIRATPHECHDDRLPPHALDKVRALLSGAGLTLHTSPHADEQLLKYRGMYEPYVNALAEQLLMELPPWMPGEGAQDDWMTSAEE
jgi:Ion channel